LVFLENKIGLISSTIKWLQTNESVAHHVFNKLVELKANLAVKCKDIQALQNLELDENKKIEETKNMLDEMIKNIVLPRFERIVDNNPSFAFFKCARIFDPSQKFNLNNDIQTYYEIPYFKNMLDDHKDLNYEWNVYINLNVDQQFEDSKSIISWWKTKNTLFPMLHSIAISILDVPPSSSEVERSFSKHTAILTAQRQSMCFENFVQYVYIAVNEQIAKLV
jgi:hAT family protein